MQTFIPHCTPEACARALDDVRLPNQANEALSIYRTLTGYYKPRANGTPGGWPYHAATRMWRGHEGALAHYRQCMIDECRRRGIDWDFAPLDAPATFDPPSWWYRADVHAAHRGMLWQKDAQHYRAWQCEGEYTVDYVWPV